MGNVWHVAFMGCVSKPCNDNICTIITAFFTHCSARPEQQTTPSSAEIVLVRDRDEGLTPRLEHGHQPEVSEAICSVSSVSPPALIRCHSAAV